MALPVSTEEHSGFFATLKIVAAWIAFWLGSISLSDLGVFAALVFTILQIVVLLRDKFGLFNSRKDKP